MDNTLIDLFIHFILNKCSKKRTELICTPNRKVKTSGLAEASYDSESLMFFFSLMFSLQLYDFHFFVREKIGVEKRKWNDLYLIIVEIYR